MSAGAPISVLVADADAATRAGIRLSLEREGFRLCAEAAGASEALESARRERPDICLVDAGLDGSGLAAAATIAADLPQTVVVVLGDAADDAELLQAVRAGVRGYLAKDMDPGRLGPSLRGALAGEALLPRAVVGRVLDELQDRNRYSAELAVLGVSLTRRELQVLELLDSGLATTDIGRALGISGITVRRHVSELLRKLGVPDRDTALRLLRGVR